MINHPAGIGSHLAAIASRQFGLINHRQLLALGFTPHAIRSWKRRGLLERILARVYRVAGAPRSWEQDAMAAILWAESSAMLWNATAAAMWKMGGIRQGPIEIAVFGERRHQGLPFKVHRLDPRLASEITELDGIPVASVPLTILAMCGTKHRRAERALDDALMKNLTDLGRMSLLYEKAWTYWRRGIAILRDLILQRTPGQAPTDSDLEDLFLGVVRDYNLPLPRRQYEIELPEETARFDFCYPEARLIIECDSYAWHMDRAAFDRDRRRTNQLAAMGWTVLRFTWAELRFRPDRVAALVMAHLERAPARSRVLSGR